MYAKMFSQICLGLLLAQAVQLLPTLDPELLKDVEISQSAEDSLFEAAKDINDQMGAHLKALGHELIKQYSKKINHTDDLHSLNADLLKGNKALQDFKLNANTITDPKKFLNELDRALKVAGVHLSEEFLNDDRKHLQYLELFSKLTEKPVPTKHWMHYLEQALGFLETQANWYDWLAGAYRVFTGYEVQKNKGKYNVANLNDWGELGRPQGILITKKNFVMFVEKLDQTFTTLQLDKVRKTEPSPVNLKHLNEVLEVTLKHQVEVSCTEDGVLLKGNTVNLGDLPEDRCQGNLVEVFATHTVYVDKDLNWKGRKAQLAVVAPNVVLVDGDRTITLDGEEAAQHPSSQGEKGTNSGTPGADGLPGNAGGSAGKFLGVTMNLKGNLKITANGGAGGDGQKGGDGYDGKRGENVGAPADVTKVSYDRPTAESELISQGFTYEKLSENEFRLFGTPGETGSDGGAGGVGGRGGLKGEVTFVANQGEKTLLSSSLEGKQGSAGAGGAAGKGGENGDNKHATAKRITIPILPPIWLGTITIKWTTYGELAGSAPDGRQGQANSNTQGQLQPEVLPNHLTSRIVNNYKNFLREELPNRVLKNLLVRFHEMLDTNEDVTSLYTTKGLVGELVAMENHYFQLKNEVDFLPLYQNYLLRVSDYASSPRQDETTLEHKKILSYLYTTALSKLCSLRDRSDHGLVVDTRAFLTLAEENIKALEANGVKYVVEEYKNDYKETLDLKVEEALTLIKQMTPDIDENLEKMYKTIDGLIEEIHQAQQEEEDKIEAYRKMSQTVTAKATLKALQFVGNCLSFLGPVGPIIGNILGGVGSALQLDTPQGMVLPEGIEDFMANAEEALKEAYLDKLHAIKDIIDELHGSLEENALEHLKPQVGELQKRSGALLEKPEVDYEGLEGIRRDLDILLVGESRKKEEVVEYFKNMTEVPADLYLKYREERNKLKAVHGAIQDSLANIQKLRDYEESVHKTMVPLMKMMQHDLDEVQANLGTQSQVGLDVSKWKVERLLREMMNQMEDFTEGFAAGKGMVRVVENIRETMKALIGIYEKIQNYQDHKQFADYLANIMSAGSQVITVEDEVLSNAVVEMQELIQTNVVLGLYERAVNAFKQFVFPFAQIYFKEFDLPSTLDHSTLVEVASKQVRRLSTKLSEYNSQSIAILDKYLINATFCADCYSGKPFYTWTSEEDEDLIKKLFSGKKVTLDANVLHSSKDAVKFQVVDLKFQVVHSLMEERHDGSKHPHKELQDKLNAALRNFTVSMTHMGNSNYRCGNDVYVIDSESQELVFSLEKDASGEPLQKNFVYEKIKSGDVMLSPYALWKVKLMGNHRNMFNALSEFERMVDISLVGRGKYVSAKSDVCSSGLEEYYHLDEDF